MSGWVFGPDVGLPDAGWMSQEEFQQKVDPPTAILPTQPTGERRAVDSRICGFPVDRTGPDWPTPPGAVDQYGNQLHG